MASSPAAGAGNCQPSHTVRLYSLFTIFCLFPIKTVPEDGPGYGHGDPKQKIGQLPYSSTRKLLLLLQSLPLLLLLLLHKGW